MVKNYVTLLLIIVFFFPKVMNAQEVQIFTVEDFDLKGNVKTCLVSTKYGKEEYDFNESGLLTKSVTRYSESDYDITTYKYTGSVLLEKRFENYRENTFDPATSIANIYTMDATDSSKITEQIVSYEKEFLDQYEYYQTNDTIRRIVRTNNEGNDETLISYEKIKAGWVKTYELNNVIKESIRTTEKNENDSLLSKTFLTKRYIEGAPSSALEEIFDGRNKLVTRIKYSYNIESEQFIKNEIENYSYDESGVLLTSNAGLGTLVEEKTYVYQFDVKDNWIKEIVTPDNTYTTRKISYYELPSKEENKE